LGHPSLYFAPDSMMAGVNPRMFNLTNKTRNMDKEELKEVMGLLRAAGMKAMLCDTPVAVSAAGVPCGSPTVLGDECIEDYYLLPKALVGMHPMMFVPADGDSMLDAGYEDGDLLRVCFGKEAHDGDDVLVYLDGACTAKTLFTDEEGTRWLVPRNEKYDAMPLTEDMDVRILGVVVGVEKTSVRASSRQLLSTIRRTKSKQRTAMRMSDAEIDKRIRAIGDAVRHARQWYAVFRMMADYEIVGEDDVPAFCERVRCLLPEHGHLPVTKEVQRMAVQSFAKRVSMWRPDNAPVTGSRFQDYLNIALMMGRMLGGEEA